MNIKKIQSKEIVLAIIIKEGEWDKGLKFVSADTDYQQVGFWNYEKGKVLQAHVHLKASREVLKTQEVIFMKQGSMRADIYDEDRVLVESLVLEKGDIGIFLNGGHGYEILENDTLVLEVKNGPYVGPEKDRERIS
ncbi:MAG: hypothetical protein FJZ43_04055 [Candidatus Staskawiczbacteria bacterium]|nr:hypothetical protein [Candidatus Staskawiczbacteria bacterium]